MFEGIERLHYNHRAQCHIYEACSGTIIVICYELFIHVGGSGFFGFYETSSFFLILLGYLRWLGV